MERNPCPNCGAVETPECTEFQHRFTGVRYFLLWCGHCDASTDVYATSLRQAERDWDTLWLERA